MNSPKTEEARRSIRASLSVAPGETELIYIHVDFFLPPKRFKKPLKVQISVTDQLTNKHKLPIITLQPVVGVKAQ